MNTVHQHSLRRALSVPAVLVLGLMLVPVAVVLAIGLSSSPTYAFPPPGLSTRWISAFFRSSAFTDALFRVSLPLALATAVASTLIGTLASVGITRSDFPGTRILEIVFIAPVVFPQILLGVGLFLLFARLGLSPGIATLAFGHVLIGTPFVVRIVGAALEGLDPRLEEAARNLGASPPIAFVKVALPLLRSSILSGAVFAFIASFSDINLALFLASADSSTLPVQILAQMQYQSDPTIAAASAVQVMVVGVLLLLAQALAQPARR